MHLSSRFQRDIPYGQRHLKTIHVSVPQDSLLGPSQKLKRETSQNLNKRFNWHNSRFRTPTAYSFCKILSTHFSKGYSKTLHKYY